MKLVAADTPTCFLEPSNQLGEFFFNVKHLAPAVKWSTVAIMREEGFCYWESRRCLECNAASATLNAVAETSEKHSKARANRFTIRWPGGRGTAVEEPSAWPLRITPRESQLHELLDLEEQFHGAL